MESQGLRLGNPHQHRRRRRPPPVGVRMVRTGVTRSFGAELRRMLALSAKSRLTAFASGLAVTGAVQSGTATHLIIPPFVSQGPITGASSLTRIPGPAVG